MNEKKSEFQKNKTAIIGGIIALVLFVSGVMFNPFETNDAGERQVVQTFGGELTVKFDPGFYFAGFNHKCTTYPNNLSIQVSLEKNKSEQADLWVAASIKDGTFSEGDNAALEHNVKWDLPNNEIQMIELHKTYNNVDNLMKTTLLSYQKKIASFSTQRLSSEAHYSGGKSQLDEYFADQLENGQVLLITETKTRTLADSSTENYIKVSPKLNGDGTWKRKSSDVQSLGIKATYTSMDNVHYDPRIYEKLKAKIDAASDEATSKQELITAQQVAKTEKAKGEQLIAKTRATEEASKIQAEIQAQKATAVAEETLKQAILNAKSDLATKKAAAEGDRLKVAAGLTPKERAEFDMKTAIGVAEALSKRDVPSIVMTGGEKGGSGSNLSSSYTMENMLLLQKQLSKK
jgi:regulator of protease activity HflC (stomatin/prohibitin superfamily)